MSNGWAAARKLRRTVDNLRRILAVELTCAGAALDLRAPLRPAPGTGAALAALRERVDGPGADRWLSPDLAAVEDGLADGAVLAAVEAADRTAGGGVMSGPRPVRAPRGSDLTCLGWPQEAAYRMLHNNLDPEVAERPDDLVVYGGTGRAARSWARSTPWPAR